MKQAFVSSKIFAGQLDGLDASSLCINDLHFSPKWFQLLALTAMPASAKLALGIAGESCYLPLMTSAESPGRVFGLSNFYTPLFALLNEAQADALALLAPEPVKGRLPENPDEILVSQALAQRLGLKVGDTVGFVAPPDSGIRGTEGTTIAAMQDSANGYLVAGIADSAQYRAWAPQGWLSELVAAHPQGTQRHWLALNAPVTWDQAKQLNQLQAFAVSRHVLTNYPSADQLYPTAPIDTNALLEAAFGVILMGILGGFLVLFLVTPALAISAEQSRRTLGLAGAAGATPHDMSRMVRAQGLFLSTVGGILGSVLGVAGSVGLGAWLGRNEHVSDGEISRYGADITLAHFPWWTIPVGITLAVILGGIAALGPARTASRMVPIDALRDRRPRHAVGKTRRRLTNAVGPALLALAVALGIYVLNAPIPAYPTDPYATGYGSAPDGSGLLVACSGAAMITAAAGIALSIRALIPRLGRFGRHASPVWRLALRDTADHPSRTVPAILGVVFSLLAASYVLVYAASMFADYRDGTTTFDWKGTFVVSPTVAISPEFDEVAARSTLAELNIPEVIGSHAILGTGDNTPIYAITLQPKGRECGQFENVHTSSARDLGAPLRCVASMSGAGFNEAVRFGSIFGTAHSPFIVDGDAVRATRLPGAEAAAKILDSGGVLVDNAALVDDDGMVRVLFRTFDGPKESIYDESGVPHGDEVLLPGAFLRGFGVDFAMSPQAAASIGVTNPEFVGLIAETSRPLNNAELREISSRDLGGLARVSLPDAPDAIGALASESTARIIMWTPIVLLTFVAIMATAVSVILSATQARRDATTMFAVGADRRFLVRLGLTRAGVILALGVPVGIGSGLAIGAFHVAWNRHLEASGAWLDTVPAWSVQVGIGAVVVLVGLLAGLVLARPPRHLVRRSLD